MAADARYTEERITALRAWTPHLFSFRLTRQAGFRFAPGQYARLGVRKRTAAGETLVWRAYSMVSAPHDEHLEFYSIVVPGGEFTTELARLRVGDAVLVDKTAHGFLTLGRFAGGTDLWLLASGTGIAPFIAIVRDAEVWERYARVILVHSVREPAELAYADTLAALPEDPLVGPLVGPPPAGNLAGEPSSGRLRVLHAVTRAHVSGTLAQRIPALIASGALEAAAGVRFALDASRIMICGNPQMVDDTRAVLTARGFGPARRSTPGQVAVENYW